ncbi:MAG: hypothetical protein EBR20_08020, partial [Bacteroidetes bacterium]|nr:hypothetical protein [Bacteroidota bacterium]
MDRFTSAWAEAWASNLRQDTEWSESAKGWKWSLLFRVGTASAWFLDLDRGECRSIRPARDAESADFILEADRATWDRILDGDRSPMVAIMQG